MEKPQCSKCRHYFITWDKNAPYGCRLYQIKTAVRPSEIVKSAGSGDCQGFEAKVTSATPRKELKEL